MMFSDSKDGIVLGHHSAAACTLRVPTSLNSGRYHAHIHTYIQLEKMQKKKIREKIRVLRNKPIERQLGQE